MSTLFALQKSASFLSWLQLERVRQHRRAFDLHGVQSIQIHPERFQDGWRYLHRCDWSGYGRRGQAGIREQHHDVGVVMREAAVLSQFLAAAGICNPDVRSDKDVRRAWVGIGGQARSVEELRNPRSPENLANTRDVVAGR